MLTGGIIVSRELRHVECVKCQKTLTLIYQNLYLEVTILNIQVIRFKSNTQNKSWQGQCFDTL